MRDRSYKVSLFCAVLLHVLLIVFLFVKFVPTAHNYMLNPNIVQATTVSQSELDRRAQRERAEIERIQKQKQEKMLEQQRLLEQAQKQKIIEEKKAMVKRELQHALQKNLLAEQQKELANLKKQIIKQKNNHVIDNKEQELQKNINSQLAAERNDLAQSRAGQMQGEVDKYKAMIIQAISSRWIIPDGVDKNASCQLLINVAPGGVVLNVQLISTSGNDLLDRSAQTAVLKASPLPVPQTPDLFNEFRVIKLTVRPEGMVSG